MKLYFTLKAIEKIGGYVLCGLFALFWIVVIYINNKK